MSELNDNLSKFLKKEINLSDLDKDNTSTEKNAQTKIITTNDNELIESINKVLITEDGRQLLM